MYSVKLISIIVCAKEAIEEKYPGVRRTYVRLKDGTLLGNVVLINPQVILAGSTGFYRRCSYETPGQTLLMLALNFQLLIGHL